MSVCVVMKEMGNNKNLKNGVKMAEKNLNSVALYLLMVIVQRKMHDSTMKIVLHTLFPLS